MLHHAKGLRDLVYPRFEPKGPGVSEHSGANAAAERGSTSDKRRMDRVEFYCFPCGRKTALAGAWDVWAALDRDPLGEDRYATRRRSPCHTSRRSPDRFTALFMAERIERPCTLAAALIGKRRPSGRSPRDALCKRRSVADARPTADCSSRGASRHERSWQWVEPVRCRWRVRCRPYKKRRADAAGAPVPRRARRETLL